ncbi:MAG: hypothetical protein WD691_04360 [Acidimicrobiales bacterium]
MAMRVWGGILATAGVLLVAGAIGIVGTWALPVGAVIGLVGSICTVILLEERELASSSAAALPNHRNHMAVAGLIVSDDGELTAA